MKIILLLLLGILNAQDEPAVEEQEETPEENQEEDQKETDDGTDNDEKEPKKTLKKTHPNLSCNQELLTSFGLKGIESPIEKTLLMCPWVTNSCAEVKDQVIAYDRWVNNGEMENVKQRFNYYNGVYDSLLTNFEEAYTKATNLHKKLENEETGNCKIIVTRITQFELDEVISKLKKVLGNFQMFWENMYKGIYCSIMDAENHKYFDIAAKKVTLSEKSCRNILENTLHHQLYFTGHFPRIANLLTRFVSSCKMNGEFTEKTIDNKYLFQVNNSIFETLQKCRDNRNEVNWLKECHFVCNNYQLLNFNSFFLPNFDQFQEYNDFFIEELRKMDSESQETNKIENQRILQEEKEEEKEEEENEEKDAENKEEEKPQEELDPKKKWKNPLVIQMDLNAVIPLEEFQTQIGEPGIDLFDNGYLSKFDPTFQSLYEQIKNQKDEELEEGEDGEGGDGEGGEGGDSENKITITIVKIITFVFLFFNQ